MKVISAGSSFHKRPKIPINTAQSVMFSFWRLAIATRILMVTVPVFPLRNSTRFALKLEALVAGRLVTGPQSKPLRVPNQHGSSLDSYESCFFSPKVSFSPPAAPASASPSWKPTKSPRHLSFRFCSTFQRQQPKPSFSLSKSKSPHLATWLKKR